MKIMQKPLRSLVSIAVLTVMANHAIHAGAFSLYTESSAAAIGNFAAGIAAEGADASIGWYNPAGLVLLKGQQAVISGVGVLPSNLLTGTSTFTTEGVESPYVQRFNNLQGAENAVVPALHYAKPLNDRVTFGLSLVSPFGLSTNWHNLSPVRYSATLTDLKTVLLSPEMGGLITDNFSVGAGLDLEWARVKFNSVLGAPSLGQELSLLDPGIAATTFDSPVYNSGDAFNVGFHAGILGLFNEAHTRIGLNYQSQIGHIFQGTSVLNGPFADNDNLADPTATFTSDTLMSNEVLLPDVLTLSAYQDVNQKLALLGSVVYTGWSCFQKLQLNGVAAFSADTQRTGPVNVAAIEDYQDSWRFAAGANYHVNEKWMMRLGGGYDQTPTVNAQRDVRLPDVSRWALSIGTHYQMNPSFGFDVGYSYLFATNDASPVNKVTDIGTLSQNTITGYARNHAQLIGLQVVWHEAPTSVGMK